MSEPTDNPESDLEEMEGLIAMGYASAIADALKVVEGESYWIPSYDIDVCSRGPLRTKIKALLNKEGKP